MKIIIEPENGPVQVWSTEPAENRAELYEKRAKELESKLTEETDRADAWEARCTELEQELRDAQERIHEQDCTIAKYDDENRDLRKRLDAAAEDAAKKCAELAALRCSFIARDLHSFNSWAIWIHEIAVQHGWWETEDGACDDGERPLPEILMLCVTELAEAMEEYRNGKPLAYQVQSYGIVEGRVEEDPAKWFPASKPEGIAIEMLDCVIRILDWMAHQNVDIDLLMRKKVKFNESRPHRHGGKKA